MSTEFILITGAILLACGCAGLLMVRFDNPRLLGVGLLGAALGSGGTGAALLLLDSEQTPFCSIVLADLLVLAALVLLHVAVMEVVGHRGIPKTSFLLLALQASSDLLKVYGHSSLHFRIIVIGFLAGAQALQTVQFLIHREEDAIRAPARFMSFVLAVFIAWNLSRSLATVTGFLAARSYRGQSLAAQVQSLTFILYLAVALGLSFGFLWMTTAGLTAKLEDLANTDPLTGVLTRRAFTRCFQHESHDSQRNGGPFALLVLDLDYFKQVNDRHGHIAGDEVLCNVVHQIRGAIRSVDVIGRWGGEEFAILLPQADSTMAQTFADRVRSNIIQKPTPVRGGPRPIPITASLGVAICKAGDSVEEAFRYADEALYRAKSAGRNCVMSATREFIPEAVAVSPKRDASEQSLAGAYVHS